MKNNRERILNLVKDNIVNKLKGRGSSFEDKKKLLERELSRNTSLFLGSDSNEKLTIEERDFILSILTELGWSTEVAKERLERLNGVLNEKQDKTIKRQAVKISFEKMEQFTDLYDKEKVAVGKEIQEILDQDYEEKKFTLLHERLWEGESITGSRWNDDEINFVVEKRNMGYSFKTIATILKRPERVVMMKYHQNK